MAKGFEVKGLDALNKTLDGLPKQMEQEMEKLILKTVIDTARDSKLNTPVDTGRLRDSQTWKTKIKDGATGEFALNTKVNILEGIVGTNVDYAPHVEFGTIKMRAQPFLHPAFKKNISIMRKTYPNIKVVKK